MKKPINLTLYCIGCRGVIPAERTKKRSNTCGDVCRNRVEKIRRILIDQRRCHFCAKPSTEEERKEWRKWKREQAKAE